MNELGCADRSRRLRGGQVSWVGESFPRWVGWPLPAEEAGYLLVGFGDGGSGGGCAEFHDGDVAIEL